jgi:hypothetical protein
MRAFVDDSVPNIRKADRVSKRGRIGSLVVLLAVIGAVSALVYFQFHPRDRIAIEITNVTVGTRFLCIVADTDEGIVAMNWSTSKVGPPFEMNPRRCTFSYVMYDGPVITNRHVTWRFGSRYGVVARQPEKVWRIHWFRAEDVPLEGRSFLFGEGTVAFDILKARTEQPAAEVLEQLGIDDVSWDDGM